MVTKEEIEQIYREIDLQHSYEPMKQFINALREKRFTNKEIQKELLEIYRMYQNAGNIEMEDAIGDLLDLIEYGRI